MQSVQEYQFALVRHEVERIGNVGIQDLRPALVFAIGIHEQFPDREILVVGSFLIQKRDVKMPEERFDGNGNDRLIESPDFPVIVGEVECDVLEDLGFGHTLDLRDLRQGGF